MLLFSSKGLNQVEMHGLICRRALCHSLLMMNLGATMELVVNIILLLTCLEV